MAPWGSGPRRGAEPGGHALPPLAHRSPGFRPTGSGGSDRPAKGHPAKGRQRVLTTNQQIGALCATMAAEQEEHDRLSRLMRKIKCGGAQGQDAAKARAGVKSDEEVIEWAKAALPGLRQWLLSRPESF